MARETTWKLVRTRLVGAELAQVPPTRPFSQRDVLGAVQIIRRKWLRRVVKNFLWLGLDALTRRWRGPHCLRSGHGRLILETLRSTLSS